MAKKQYMFYPGCTAEKMASGSNYMTSVDTICEVLDIQLNEIPDWNCCGASIGYAGCGELERLAMNARNLALAEETAPEQDIVATCAACWLGARETRDRLTEDAHLMQETNEALAEAGLKYQGKQAVRHMVEVLIEDIGYDGMARHVKKPLAGIKMAGYVGCQTNRPFGIEGESFENPVYLDKFIEIMGAEPITNYQKKVSCCGGGVAFGEPEKAQVLIKDIVEAAYDSGAEMIVTPCPVCQMNVEVYQDQINQRYGTKFHIPVVYYSTLMAVAYGKTGKQAGLDGQVIRATRLEQIAAK